MPRADLTVWAVFIAALAAVAVVVTAFVVALVITQRRRLAVEREHSRRLVAAQEEERSRVARELHDDALQRLAAIRHEVDDLVRLGGPEAAHKIGGITGEMEDLSIMLRTAAHQLHPSIVEKAGLVRALGELAAEFGRTATLDVHLALPPSDVAVSAPVGVAAYRIAQEALRNVVRHAKVASADLTLVAHGGSLTLRVSDAGAGLPPGAGEDGGGLGLIAMRQRAEAAGGSVTVAPGPERGTVVTVVFPNAEAS